MAYYKALVKYGDYPIVDKVLPDREEILLEYSTRAPRNEVARQILKDLDEAINRMHDQVSKTTSVSTSRWLNSINQE